MNIHINNNKKKKLTQSPLRKSMSPHTQNILDRNKKTSFSTSKQTVIIHITL